MKLINFRKLLAIILRLVHVIEARVETVLIDVEDRIEDRIEERGNKRHAEDELLRLLPAITRDIALRSKVIRCFRRFCHPKKAR